MTSAFQQSLCRAANSPAATRLQRRPTRRLLFTAMLLTLGFAALSMGEIPHDPLRLPAVIVPLLGIALLLNLSIGCLFELDEALLDEFQLALRNAAYKRAYGFALVFLLALATVAAGLDLDRIEIFAAATFAFLTVAMAPRLAVAWSMDEGTGETMDAEDPGHECG